MNRLRGASGGVRSGAIAVAGGRCAAGAVGRRDEKLFTVAERRVRSDVVATESIGDGASGKLSGGCSDLDGHEWFCRTRDGFSGRANSRGRGNGHEGSVTARAEL